MTGPEHYRMAEKLLGGVFQFRSQEGSEIIISLAQVHATLAMAAAIALADDMPRPDHLAWYHAASGKPEADRQAREAEKAELAEYEERRP